MPRGYFVSLMIVLVGAFGVFLFSLPAAKKGPEVQKVLILPPAEGKGDDSILLYPRSGVRMTTDDSVTWFNNTDDQIQYVVFEDGKFVLVRTEPYKKGEAQ